MPKRIVLTCWGSYGDLFPSLGLAVRLKALGHTPIVATCAFYRDMVEREGIAFHPVRPDIDPSDADTIRRVMDPARGTEVILRELLVPFLRDSFSDLSDVVSGADVLVSHPITFAAPLVGASLGRPWLSTVLAPTSFFSVHDFPLLPPYPSVVRAARAGPWAARAFMRLARRITGPWTAPIRAFRDEHGLPDRGDPLYEGQFSPFGTLALFSPILGSPQADWPVHTRATGFVFRNDPTGLSPELREFLDAGEPPIVFTLGSSAVGAAGSFYAESARAAQALGRRAVLLAGRDPRNRSGTPLPPTIMAAEYAPHDALFRRALAVVHHGGVGTTAEALRAGRPMLVVPHAHDQPDNAFRMRNLGVARVLDARRYNAGRAARHLRALLAEPGLTDRARDLGQQVARERGAETACDEILRCAGGTD